MRKLGRILRRVLTALSLLLFVAVLAAWVRGSWSSDSCFISRTVIDAGGLRSHAASVAWGGARIAIRWHVGAATVNDLQGACLKDGVWWHTEVDHFSPRPVGPLLLPVFFGSATGPHAIDAESMRAWNDNHWNWNHAGIILVWQKEQTGRVFPNEMVDWNSFKKYRLLPTIIEEMNGVAFPCWMGAVVFGGLPVWRGVVWWRGWRRRRVAGREGRCLRCGYDLRGTPGRCPECGLVVEVKNEARRHAGT